jgi:hypothetical protein
MKDEGAAGSFAPSIRASAGTAPEALRCRAGLYAGAGELSAWPGERFEETRRFGEAPGLLGESNQGPRQRFAMDEVQLSGLFTKRKGSRINARKPSNANQFGAEFELNPF